MGIEKNALAEELVGEVGGDIEALIERQAGEELDLEALESAVREQAPAVG